MAMGEDASQHTESYVHFPSACFPESLDDAADFIEVEKSGSVFRAEVQRARPAVPPHPQAAGGWQRPRPCSHFPGHSVSGAGSEARGPGCRKPRRSVLSPRLKGWLGFAVQEQGCWGRRVRLWKERRIHVPGTRRSPTQAPSAKLPGGFPWVCTW